MALIKCTGCGHEVSDKASACPHCGCPIQQENRNLCKECGTEVPDDATVCPNCGCPTDNTEAVQEEVYYDEEPEKKRWWLWVLGALLLCLIGGGAFYFLSEKDTPVAKISNDEKKDSLEVKEDIVELTPEFIKAIKKYSQVGMFSEGYAAVRKGDNWGYINTKGEEVIPTTIDACCVGRFSDGLAFILETFGDFKVIDTNEKTIFKGETCFDAMHYHSETMPYYIDGKLYVDTHDTGDYKYNIYDKRGNKISTVEYEEGERFYKQNERGKYTIFKKKHGTGDDEFTTIGLKDSSGNVVLPAEYDCINGLREGKTDFCNGVVLVVLAENTDYSDYDYDDGVGYENYIYYYGYADLKGNDTFTAEVKNRCKQSKIAAMQNLSNDDSDWLQGRWVGTDSYSGYPVEMIIDGDNLIQKMNSEVCYNGSYQFNGDMLIYNNANDFWPVDKDNHVLTLNGSPMRKESGSSYSSSSSSSSSYDNSSSNSGSYRFSSASDVIGYLSDRTFYNGSRRLRIRPDGVWLNDYCATGAPNVERYESWKALIRAFTATGERLSFLIDPIHGEVTDEAGDVFRLR